MLVSLTVDSGSASLYVNTYDQMNDAKTLTQKLPDSKQKAAFSLDSVKSSTAMTQS